MGDSLQMWELTVLPNLLLWCQKLKQTYPVAEALNQFEITQGCNFVSVCENQACLQPFTITIKDSMREVDSHIYAAQIIMGIDTLILVEFAAV